MMRVFNAWPQLISFLAEMGGVATGNEEKPNVVGLPLQISYKAGDGIRTRDILLGRQALYR